MASLERWRVAPSVEISRIGLGGIEFGPDDEPPDTTRAVRVLESAIACGVNWLDTSENYIATRNESLIGEALARVRGEVLVASKVAPGEVRRAAEAAFGETKS